MASDLNESNLNDSSLLIYLFMISNKFLLFYLLMLLIYLCLGLNNSQNLKSIIKFRYFLDQYHSVLKLHAL